MYRPPGWKTYKKSVADKPFAGRLPTLHSAFEAGADAYEKGLRKQNVTLPDILHHYILGKLGKLVIIPEERE